MRRAALAALAAVLAGACLPAAAGAKTTYTVIGHGYGHGIGMGQYGALGYAEHGWTARRMLAHYYHGTRLGSLRGAARYRRQRVLLDERRSVLFGSSAALRVVNQRSGRSHRLPAGSYRLVRGLRPGRLRVLRGHSSRIVLSGLSSPVLVRAGRAPLAYGGGHWHGSFRVIRDHSQLLLVNVVRLEQYLRGVVPREMPASWPGAALRAQAIAARSYAVATRKSGDFDAYADTRSQVYGPIEGEDARSNAAVAATAHRVVTYRGGVALTLYSASTGGRTASEQAAWGTSSGEPYLVPVNDAYDAARGANPYHTWRFTYTGARLGQLLDLRGIQRFSTSIDRRSRRVLAITFAAAGGAVTRPAADVVGPLGLRSTYFRLRAVSLSVKSPVRRGQPDVLRGRIVPRFTSRVALQRRVPGGTWVTVAQLRVGSDGSFSRRLAPRVTHEFRLHLRVTASPVVRVTVKR